VIGSKISVQGVASVVTDPESMPNPAHEALDEPHLDAEELEREIGDSEVWDEASEDTGGDALNPQ
jgi:hypothetical protein